MAESGTTPHVLARHEQPDQAVGRRPLARVRVEEQALAPGRAPTTSAAESCGVSASSRTLTPSGIAASCVMRASCPPPIMPTTGKVTPKGYRRLRFVLRAGRGRKAERGCSRASPRDRLWVLRLRLKR